MNIKDIVPYISVFTYKRGCFDREKTKEILISPDTELELEAGFDYRLSFIDGTSGEYLHNHIYKIGFDCHEDMIIPFEGLLDSDYLREHCLDKISIYDTYYKGEVGDTAFILRHAFISKNLDEFFDVLDLRLDTMRELLDYDEFTNDVKRKIISSLVKKICDTDPERYGYLEF